MAPSETLVEMNLDLDNCDSRHYSFIVWVGRQSVDDKVGLNFAGNCDMSVLEVREGSLISSWNQSCWRHKFQKDVVRVGDVIESENKKNQSFATIHELRTAADLWIVVVRNPQKSSSSAWC